MAEVINEECWDWLFNYNPYKKKWFAFKRKNLVKYFNGELKESEMPSSKSIGFLNLHIRIITRKSYESKKSKTKKSITS